MTSKKIAKMKSALERRLRDVAEYESKIKSTNCEESKTMFQTSLKIAKSDIENLKKKLV